MNNLGYSGSYSGDSSRGSVYNLPRGMLPPVFPRLRSETSVYRAAGSEPPVEAGFVSSEEEMEMTADVAIFPSHRQASLQLIKEFFCCPICHGPFIETTLTNCGHKFCKQCIMTNSKEKEECPMCCALVSTYQRSFSDDNIIESQLPHLPLSFQEKFRTAQQARVQKFVEDQKKKQSLPGILRAKMDSAVIFLKNQRSTPNVHGESSLYRCLPVLNLVNCLKLTMTVMLVIVAILFLTCHHNGCQEAVHFIQYMYNAVRNYNGTIPDAWLEPPKLENRTDESQIGIFSFVVNYLKFF